MGKRCRSRHDLEVRAGGGRARMALVGLWRIGRRVCINQTRHRGDSAVGRNQKIRKSGRGGGND